jgi:hypothetical protein
MEDGVAEDAILMRIGADGKRTPMKQRRHQRWWTEKRRTTFLNHLAETCNVTASLQVVGVANRAGVYSLRRRDAQFRAAWDEALAQGYARLEAELLDRAINGKRVMTERDGVMVEKIVFSDTLGLNLLSQHRRAVADYRAAIAALGPREDVTAVRARIVERIMAIVDALPDRTDTTRVEALPA